MRAELFSRAGFLFCASGGETTWMMRVTCNTVSVLILLMLKPLLITSVKRLKPSKKILGRLKLGHLMIIRQNRYLFASVSPDIEALLSLVSIFSLLCKNLVSIFVRSTADTLLE